MQAAVEGYDFNKHYLATPGKSDAKGGDQTEVIYSKTDVLERCINIST